MKNITILGATGSIGLSTLGVIDLHREKYRVFALSANTNWQAMLELCHAHQPKYAVMVDADAAEELQNNLDSDTTVLSGKAALVELAAHPETDYVMAAIVGAAGMASALAAAQSGKRIMLANKESLVLAGDLFMDAVKHSGAELIPVDSEHSAIFQCLQGGVKGLSKIQLTASGGPFLGVPLAKLGRVTPDEACAHPNWSMGRKISVDSATMMNKGLEVIEAHFLFSLSHENIDVVIHPQSIIHSFAYFDDGSVLSQLGLPDMRTAISYALSYPERHNSGVGMLDLTQQKSLEFYPPDLGVFSCLRLAYDSLKTGKSAAGTLNAANEIAVAAFLNNKISFLEIGSTLEKTLEVVPVVSLDTLDDVMENDQLSRQVARSIIEATCG
ncbi:MAG: 1-deoxy-D-xylulose-5-phosphate reductoisomerase [Gammaproteobacteria bacterium]|nr:1-deoxy-D-xylulose-5-phosphate reductoisomerase [Gammaproteobacteria bacterium]